MHLPKLTRRNALGLAAAGTALSACGELGSGQAKRIAVVGGGIVGASIAWHLAKGGAAVTLIERHELATRASRGTFAWLNATWAKQPRAYHALNQMGLAGWRDIEAELGLPIKWTGSLEWFDGAARQVRLAEQIAEQIEWGEPARMVPRAELEAMEPNVDFADATTAALSPNDGALDPVLATRMLVESAVSMGAEVRTDCEVTGVRGGQGLSVLETSCGEIECDHFVLATGADPTATQTLAGIDIPQRSTPGVIVVTEPLDPLIEAIVVAPGVHIHQRLDGRVVLGEQQGAPQTQAHAQRLANRPNAFPTPELGLEHAGRILEIARRYVPALGEPRVEDVFIGWRPLPLDGHPAMGFSPANPNAYIAIAHSGVTLAPIIGQLAAQELLTGAANDRLSDYRPTRSFEEVRRY